MKANRPGQTLVAIIKPAADEITNHGNEFVEIRSLGRHFRLVAGRHQHLFVLFDLEHELVLHEASLPHKTESGKSALACPLYPHLNQPPMRHESVIFGEPVDFAVNGLAVLALVKYRSMP